MKLQKIIRTALLIVVVISITSGSASAMSRTAAIPLEIAGGYGIGIGASIVALNIAGGYSGFESLLNGIIAVVFVYPIASTIGVYGVGELAEGDSVNDIKSFGYTLGASALTTGVSLALSAYGPALAFVLTPLVGTLTYNLVKEVVVEDDVQPSGAYTPLISFSVGF